jgi:hypothetical protein
MIGETCAEARTLFATRDRLTTDLRAVDNRLQELRAQYMTEARVWALGPERFRQAAHEPEAVA